MAKTARTILGVALLFVLPALVRGGQATGQAPSDIARPQAPAPDARLERLAGLARLWLDARYFHPALAHKDIDWDAALVAAIPRVDRARTPVEYRDAIGDLLAVLGDPETFAALDPGVDAPAAAVAVPRPSRHAPPVRDAGGATLIDIVSLATTMGSDGAKIQPLMAEARAALAKDGPFLIDCRGAEAPDAESSAEAMLYFMDTVLRDLLRGLVPETIPLGAPRYRQYSGYPPQQGTTSGGYSTAVVTSTPQRLEGTRTRGPQPRAAVLVDGNTPDIREILSGLRAAGVAWVVREDRTGDVRRGMTSAPLELTDGVRVHLRTVDVVSPDGVVGVDPDVTVRRGPNDADVALARALELLRGPAVTRTANPATSAGPARPLIELAYPTMTAPTREYRLLALFRFWGVIDRFFPYKHLLETPWSEVLPRFIPVFESAEGTLAYQTAVHELVAQIKDTHGTISGTSALHASLGGFAPRVALGYAGRVLVILAVGETAPGDGLLTKGDEVLAIDGESIEARVARLGRLIAASTPQALRWRTRALLTAGAQGSRARFTIRDGAGQTRDVEVARQMPINQLAGFVRERTSRTTPIYGLLPSGPGYIDLARLQNAEANAALDAVLAAPGLIFDMRGYPNGTAWTLAPRLTTRTHVVGAQFRRPLIDGLSWAPGEDSVTSYAFPQELPPPSGPAYRGKVVVIINEEAISQAEHTCLFIEAAAPNVTFIGSPTNGANGDVTNVPLPGGIVVRFSGHDVRHADGRQLQRIGITPHVLVEPTPAGVRAGRDELLEAAIRHLAGK
jgi:C-terminal processing protease CtpA/Prc